MQKFKLLHQHLKNQGIATPTNTFRPGTAKLSLLSQAHCPEYLKRFIHNQMTAKEVRRMGLPWSQGLLRRTLISPVGTLYTAHLALEHGMACHLAGGTHHAHYDFASGFCILNDLAITAKTLKASGKVQRILIFDVDVHQGDGTARILADDDDLFTCSIHCEKNFPARKASSNLDVNLPIKMTDQAYLTVIEQTLQQAIELSQPDLVIYDAGVDVYAHDPLGLINISLDGIKQRDRLVLQTCLQQQLPVATVIGGGYDKDEIALSQRHAIVTEQAAELFTQIS